MFRRSKNDVSLALPAPEPSKKIVNVFPELAIEEWESGRVYTKEELLATAWVKQPPLREKLNHWAGKILNDEHVCVPGISDITHSIDAKAYDVSIESYIRLWSILTMLESFANGVPQHRLEPVKKVQGMFRYPFENSYEPGIGCRSTSEYVLSHLNDPTMPTGSLQLHDLAIELSGIRPRNNWDAQNAYRIKSRILIDAMDHDPQNVEVLNAVSVIDMAIQYFEADEVQEFQEPEMPTSAKSDYAEIFGWDTF